MLELILFRHGIAIDREDPECPDDADRPLTERGRTKTRASARGLRRLGTRPDRVLASPYLRAIQTAGILAEEFGLDPGRVEVVDGLLPFDSPRRFFDTLPFRSESVVAAVGHAPHMDALLALCVDQEDPFTRIGKAGAAKLSFHEPSLRKAELDWILPARLLRALGA